MSKQAKAVLSIAVMAIFITNVFPFRILTAASEAYDLLIIGPESYRERFRRFIEFKEFQGIVARYFSVEWISTSIRESGIVNRIHKFVAEEYTKSGINYLLLVGTYEQVPAKYVYSPSDEFGLADFNYKPTDWYYAVPDWEESNIGFLGGNIPKIAVGRLPVKNEEELEQTLSKIIEVESQLEPGSLLFLGDSNVELYRLLSNPYCHYES